MITKVCAFIEANQMLQPGDTVAAGISGGADSVCLLFMLLKIQESIPFRLTAVHVNHKIREEAGDDAAFVEELCRKWGCPYRCVEEDVEAYARARRISTEEAGRTVRYGAFARVLEEAGAPGGKIAVAHNQNDNAETVLFHLMRGTGLSGLAGIRPVRERVIRPLLCVSREEIEAFLGKNRIPYRIDKTNCEDTYTRNKIRHHILPYAQEEICRRAVSHIYDTSVILEEASRYIDRHAREAMQRCAAVSEREIIFDVNTFIIEDSFLQKQVLLTAMGRLAGSRKDISSVHVQALLGLFYRDKNGRIDLPYGLTAYREYRAVRLCTDTEAGEPPGEVVLSVPGVTAYCGMIFSASIFPNEKSRNIPQKTYTKWFDYDKIIEYLVLRTRRTGDYLKTLSGGGGKSLKAYLIGEKIPAAQRDRLPLLADGSHIVWVVGRRMSEHYKIDEGTKTVLQIQVAGGTEDGGEDQGTVDRERGR